MQNIKIINFSFRIRNQHCQNTKNGNFYEDLTYVYFGPKVPQKGVKHKNYQF